MKGVLTWAMNICNSRSNIFSKNFVLKKVVNNAIFKDLFLSQARVTETERLRFSIFWFTSHKPQQLALSEVEVRNQELCQGFPHGCSTPSTWAICHCFPGCMGREPNQKSNSLDLNPCPHGRPTLQMIS